VSDLDGCVSSLPNGIRSPYPAAPSESLYRLRYPGPHNCIVQALSSISVKKLCVVSISTFVQKKYSVTIIHGKDRMLTVIGLRFSSK
jgi:hypothetical protein